MTRVTEDEIVAYIKCQVMMVIVYPNGTEEIIEPATGFQKGFKYTP